MNQAIRADLLTWPSARSDDSRLKRSVAAAEMIIGLPPWIAVTRPAGS